MSARRGPGRREAHHQWKGDRAGYRAALARVRALRGKAAEQPCSDCGSPAFRWTFVAGSAGERMDQEGHLYSLDESAYVPLCARCHKIGRNAA